MDPQRRQQLIQEKSNLETARDALKNQPLPHFTDTQARLERKQRLEKYRQRINSITRLLDHQKLHAQRQRKAVNSKVDRLRKKNNSRPNTTKSHPPTSAARHQQQLDLLKARDEAEEKRHRRRMERENAKSERVMSVLNLSFSHLNESYKIDAEEENNASRAWDESFCADDTEGVDDGYSDFRSGIDDQGGLLDPDDDLLGFAGEFQGAPDDDTENETAMKAPPTYNETATTENGGTKAATLAESVYSHQSTETEHLSTDDGDKKVMAKETSSVPLESGKEVPDDEDKKVKAKETSPAGNEYDIFGSLQGLNLDDATFDFNPDASFSPISDLDPNDVLLRPVEVNPSAPFRGKSADTLGVLRKSTADQNYGEVEEEDVDEDEVQSEDESSGAVQSEDEDESSEIEEGDTVEIWDGSIYDGHVGRVDQIKNAGYHYVNIGGVIHCVRGKSNLKKTTD